MAGAGSWPYQQGEYCLYAYLSLIWGAQWEWQSGRCTKQNLLGRNPTKMTLNDGLSPENLQHIITSLNPTLTLLPKTTSQYVLQTIHWGKFGCNILTGGLVVTINWTQSEDPIEAFEDLCRISDCGPKPANVLSKVSKKMKFHFGDNFRGINISKCIENISH